MVQDLQRLGCGHYSSRINGAWQAQGRGCGGDANRAGRAKGPGLVVDMSRSSPSRSWSSLSFPVFSVSQEANHLANPAVNSSRLSEPSLLISKACMTTGARKIPGPK